MVNLQASSLTRTYTSNAETRDFAPITLRFLFLLKGGGRLHKTSLVSLKGLNPSRTVMKRIASSHWDLQRPYLMPSEKALFFFKDHTTFKGQSSPHSTPSASIPVTLPAQSVKMSIFINTLQSRSNQVRSQLPGHPSGRCKPASNRFDTEAVT